MFKKKDILLIKDYLKNIDYIEFIDPIETNDYDFGSYKRVAQLHQDKRILFLNSHSYPICDNWYRIIGIGYRKAWLRPRRARQLPKEGHSTP